MDAEVIPTLDALCVRLREEFQRGTDDLEHRIKRVLGQYRADPEEWGQFAVFDPYKYTRNLIEQNEHYLLMLLCWSPCQQSPIHDHAGSDCWLRVLKGDLVETLYDYVENVPPIPRRNTCFHAGQISYINDTLGIHMMSNKSCETSVCTLHLYAPPYSTCQVFERDTGRALVKPITFHTIRGVKTKDYDAPACPSNTIAPLMTDVSPTA